MSWTRREEGIVVVAQTDAVFIQSGRSRLMVYNTVRMGRESTALPDPLHPLFMDDYR